MTVVCCRLPCTACKAVVARSLDTRVASCAGGAVNGVSAQPSQPSGLSCRHWELRCHKSGMHRHLYGLETKRQQTVTLRREPQLQPVANRPIVSTLDRVLSRREERNVARQVCVLWKFDCVSTCLVVGLSSGASC